MKSPASVACTVLLVLSALSALGPSDSTCRLTDCQSLLHLCLIYLRQLQCRKAVACQRGLHGVDAQRAECAGSQRQHLHIHRGSAQAQVVLYWQRKAAMLAALCVQIARGTTASVGQSMQLK